MTINNETKMTATNRMSNFNFESFVINNYTRDDVIKYAFIGLGQGGGKVSIEFNKINYFSSLFNTAQSDLSDAISTLSINNNTDNPIEGLTSPTVNDFLVDGKNYRVTPFGTLGGANKDRYFGKEAVVGNFELLKTRLVSDQNITNADFVWTVASLGGGTASGSVTEIVRIVSGFIRKDEKRFRFRKGTRILRALPGTPTVGVIALWPEDSASPKVKLNAAEALQELETLQREGLLGNILLIDNQKLLDEAISENIEDWQKHCNSRIVQHLTEASILTNLSSDTSVDRAELMEVITQPGFLNITKATHEKLDIYNNDKKSTSKNVIDLNKCKNLAKEIVENTHFTDKYSKEDALKTIFMTLTNKNHPTFNKTTFYTLQSEVAKYQDTAIVHHQGMYNTNRMVTANQESRLKELSKTNAHIKLTNSNAVIFYHLCVYKHMPQKYIDIINHAIDKREKDLVDIQKKEHSLKNLSFSTIDKVIQPELVGDASFAKFAGKIEETLALDVNFSENTGVESFEDFFARPNANMKNTEDKEYSKETNREDH